MSAIVETVATALWDSLAGDTHSGGGWDFQTGNCNVSLDQKERFRKMARAAIAALREPTQAMLDATYGGHGEYNGVTSPQALQDWQAMIDEALK